VVLFLLSHEFLILCLFFFIGNVGEKAKGEREGEGEKGEEKKKGAGENSKSEENGVVYCSERTLVSYSLFSRRFEVMVRGKGGKKKSSKKKR